ncbi:MAG: helix-turn-helix domain-containing protein [Solirubrobacteraceae bacterium]
MSTEPRTRDRQTRRTRRALLAAADELFAEGRVPTVAEVAERADVARATAYRYFPTQESLLLETTFFGDSGPLRSLPDLVQDIPDPAARLAEAVRRSAIWTLEREPRLRTILRLSLEHGNPARPQRPARRRHYIAELLSDVRDRLAPGDYAQLAGALTLLFGIDPIVSLRDNGDVAPEQIPEVLGWTAAALVTAALSDATP